MTKKMTLILKTLTIALVAVLCALIFPLATNITAQAAENPTPELFTVTNNTVAYNGAKQEPTVTSSEINTFSLYYKQNDLEVDPIEVGVYEIWANIVGDANYNTALLKIGTMTITKMTYESSKLVVAPASSDYTGQPHVVNVEYSGPGPIGAITTKVYNADGDLVTDPTEAGTYTVKVDIAETGSYNAVTDLDAGTYTILPASIEAASVSGVNPYQYTGSEIEFQYNSITLNGNTLVKDVDYTLSITGATNVGTYPVTISGIGNYTGTYIYNFAITPGDIRTATVTLGSDFTYNGTALTKEVVSVVWNGATLVAGTDYIIDGNTQTDAGDYTLSVIGQGNFSWGLDYDWSIAKADYDMSAVKLENGTFVYDGTAKSLVVSGTLPTGADGIQVTVSYDNNSLTNVADGPKTVTANFATTSTNYNVPASMTATLTVTKADYDMSAVKLENGTFVYDGTAKSLAITGTLPTGADGIQVTVSYSNNGKTNVLDTPATVTASFATTSTNYNVPASKTATLTIEKADYDMSGVSLNDQEIVYDKTAHTLTITGTLPTGADGIQVTVSYTSDFGDLYVTTVPEGVKTITANFATTSTNYNVPASMSAQIWIVKAVLDIPAEDTNAYVYNTQPQTYGIPTHIDYTIENATQTDAGEYDVIVSLNDTDNFEWNDGTIEEKHYVFIILRAKIDIPAEYDGWEYIYNGQDQVYDIVRSDLYTLTNDVQSEAGVYDVIITINDKKNYEWTDGSDEDIVYVWEILKANYDMSAITFVTQAFVYDGNAHTVTITGELPTGHDGIQLEVFYDGITVTDFNEGEKRVLAHFTTASNNYVAPADMEAYISIVKAYATVPAADETEYVYNGKAQTYAIAENEMYTVTGATQVDAGSYTVTVSLNDNYAWEDGTLDDVTYDFVIGKADYDVSGLTLTGGVFAYDGFAHTAKFSGKLPVGADGIRLTATVSDESVTNATDGEKTVTVTFATESSNYNTPEGLSAKISISKIKVNKPVSDNGTFVYSGSEKTYIIAKSGNYTISGNKQTDAGEYVVTVSLNDKANYEWTDGTTDDLTFDFVISKATYVLKGVVFSDRTFIYDGKAHTATVTGNLPDGLTVTYDDVSVTDVADGEKTVTATFVVADTDNYNVPEAMTAKIKVVKAQVTKPALNAVSKTYDGKVANVAVKANDAYTVTGESEIVNVGEYAVVVALNDKANYEWADGTTDDLTVAHKITKATYGMGGISYSDKTVVYDGKAHGIEIAGKLPEGVEVSYTAYKTEAGIYEFVATFTGDATNYEAIPAMTATLTIRQAGVKLDDGSVSSANGLAPGVEVSIKEVEAGDYGLGTYEQVAKVYDVTFTEDGASVQPDGVITIKLRIPEEIKGEKFKVLHVHGDKVTTIGYKIEGDYAVISTTELSEFVFVYEQTSLMWIIIVLGVVVALEVIALVIILMLGKKKATACSVAPVLFAAFIPTSHIVTVVILGVAVVGLAIADVVLLIKNKNK